METSFDLLLISGTYVGCHDSRSIVAADCPVLPPVSDLLQYANLESLRDLVICSDVRYTEGRRRGGGANHNNSCFMSTHSQHPEQ